MANETISIEGLTRYDELIKQYIAGQSGSNTTYTLTKSGDQITLTGSDGSTDSVTDSDTTALGSMTGILGIAHGGSGQDGTDYINTPADLITAGSGVTVSAARFAYWGKCAMLQLNVARSSAIANGGTFTIGTVTAGHRPLYQAGGSGAQLIGQLATNGTITARNVSGSQIAANTTVYITFTYLLP